MPSYEQKEKTSKNSKKHLTATKDRMSERTAQFCINESKS